MSEIHVVNRYIYGSRLYSHARPDSDYDYAAIIDEASIGEALNQLHAFQDAQARGERFEGKLRFSNPELDDFVFTDAFIRRRDLLLFFDHPESDQSLCICTREHFEALIKINALWVLEILFADDQHKLYPESLRDAFEVNPTLLSASLSYECELAIRKGMYFAAEGEEYKSHKNYYFAHRFSVYARQLLTSGEIYDYEEPVRLFYLKPFDKSGAVKSLSAYLEDEPRLNFRGPYRDHPLRVAPRWVTLDHINLKEINKTRHFLNLPDQSEIQINNRVVPLSGGRLSRKHLLENKLNMIHFTTLTYPGGVLYDLSTYPFTPSAEIHGR